MQVVHLLEFAEFQILEAWHHRLPDLERLAEDGDVQAQFVLGAHYLQGSYGKRRDIGRALSWYRRAADGGGWRAALALARLYEQGTDGLPADRREARRWAERAASLPR